MSVTIVTNNNNNIKVSAGNVKQIIDITDNFVLYFMIFSHTKIARIQIFFVKVF